VNRRLAPFARSASAPRLPAPRRVPIPRLAGAAVVFALLASGVAHAEPKDKAALDLAKQAIEVDYLGTNFAAAEKKLTQALALCKGNACSAKVRAQVHRDLGVVDIAGLKKVDEGKKNFVEALKADPSIVLDQDLATPEVQAAFDEARKTAGVAAPPAAEEAAPAKPPPAAEEEEEEEEEEHPAAEGDLTHEPPSEQAVLTPVPIYAELPEGMKASKLTVRYKPFGASAWKSVQMSRLREGYGAEIPCLDVGSATGDLEYFIQATSEAGDVVAFSGTRNAPHRVPIKNELEGDPPNLPGKPPPAQCADTADCPPEFPGCKSGDEGGAGAEGEAGPIARNWASLAYQLDVLFHSSTTGVCSGGTEYSCFYSDDSYYALVPVGDGNEVQGGPAIATMRFLLGFERIFGENLGVGIKVGYAIGGGPKAPDGKGFFPIHAEARLSYYFGNQPFRRKGLRPFLHVGGGIAQVDGKVVVSLFPTPEDLAADSPKKLNAWRKTGVGFAGLGGGLMYAIKPNHGPYLDVTFMQMFGESGTVLAPQAGYAVGF
jgi:hypothetical protein